jgi:hypothetical protein
MFNSWIDDGGGQNRKHGYMHRKIGKKEVEILSGW